MSLSLAHTTTPTRNKHNRGAASAIIEVTVCNGHNHDSGRYAGLGERKSICFALISLVWCLMGYYELKFSSHDHSDTMLVWVNEKAIFCSAFSRVVFDGLL